MNTPKLSRLIESVADVFNAGKIAELLTEPAKKHYIVANILLPNPVRKPDDFTSEASLLRPEFQIASFNFRTKEFEEFSGWCNSSEPFAWRLVHGDSGRGKSRLMVELCTHFNGHATGNHWVAGFVNVEKFRDNPDSFELLFDEPKPLLIVLDYAERQSEVVIQLLRRSYERAVSNAKQTTRVLLIARRSTDLWNNVFNSDEVLQTLGRSRLQDVNLSSVTETASVEDVFETAYGDFAQHFGKTESVPQFDFSKLAPNGHHPDIGLVHMLALLAVLSPEELNWQSNSRPTQDELLGFLLGREIRFWQKAAKGMGLPPELCKVPVLSEAAALLTLSSQQGAITNADEARSVLRNGTLLHDQSQALLDLMVTVFRETYSGIGYVNGVAPDLLGDFLIMNHMGKDV
jgi:hypothetical protein